MTVAPAPRAAQGRMRPVVRLNLAGVPAELQARAQWVVWRYDGSSKQKTPYSVRGRDYKASSTDPRTWASFAAAVAAYQRGGYDGIGYVFAADDPFAGVDLDHCRINGVLSDEARRLVAELGSYAEASPSGSGIKAIVRATVGRGRRLGALEIYDRARYFTITGQRIEGAPATIADAQAAIDTLLGQAGGAVEDEPAPAAAPLDWGFVAWLEARMYRLWKADGVPYGCTPQLLALLKRDELPAGLAAKGNSASERRALVVRQLARAGYLPEEVYVLGRAICLRFGYTKRETRNPIADLNRDILGMLPEECRHPISAPSMARRAAYLGDATPPAPAPADVHTSTTRRAACSADAYLDALRGMLDVGAVVLKPRAERAQAAGVHVKTAQRLEAQLAAAGAIELVAYRRPGGRATRVHLRGDVHTSNTTIAPSAADVHTPPAEHIETPQTASSADNAIREDTSSPVGPAPVAPPPEASAPSASPSPLPASKCPDLGELVADALDAYGTAGGGAAFARVAAHVRALSNGRYGLRLVKKVYADELKRRKFAREDERRRQRFARMGVPELQKKRRNAERRVAEGLVWLPPAMPVDFRADLPEVERRQRWDERRSAVAKARRQLSFWRREYAAIEEAIAAKLPQMSAEAEEAALFAELDAYERKSTPRLSKASRPAVTLRPAAAAQPPAQHVSPPPAAQPPADDFAALLLDADRMSAAGARFRRGQVEKVSAA